MNSTHHSNQISKQENGGNTSFSFSYEKDRQVDPQKLLSKVRVALQEILNVRHSNYEKRTIHPKSGRLNFACPYCGDSHTDTHKKRGNIYIDKLYFKCYNCGKYADVYNFLKDFDKAVLDTDEMLYVKETEASTKKESANIDPSYLFDIERLKAVAVDRNLIEEKLNLKRIDKSSISTYLTKRLQPRMELFSWNQEREQLYIFHLIPDTNLVLGFQIRNFKSQPKYMTYRLSRIYEMFDKEITEDIEEIDHISTTFGILEANLSIPITVFEGPLDSFLYKNSVATCSTNIDVPVDLSTLRYFFDYDKAGRDASIQKLKEGKPVFLWKKFFKEAHIDEPTNKKMDLTDLIVLAKRKGISLPRLSNYFSNDKYDAYWI
jgi:predicted RNA-binding Zn-ribbon protein involved in translation (DUF1610 family)